MYIYINKYVYLILYMPIVDPSCRISMDHVTLHLGTPVTRSAPMGCLCCICSQIPRNIAVLASQVMGQNPMALHWASTAEWLPEQTTWSILKRHEVSYIPHTSKQKTRSTQPFTSTTRVLPAMSLLQPLPQSSLPSIPRILDKCNDKLWINEISHKQHQKKW